MREQGSYERIKSFAPIDFAPNIPTELFLQRSTVDSILGGVAAPTPPKPLWKAVALLPQRAAQLQLVCPFCILPIPDQQPLLATSEWIRSFFL